jgi:hypothetical protein
MNNKPNHPGDNLNAPDNREGRSKNEVYAWAPYSTKEGLCVGGQKPGCDIDMQLFKQGLPIDQAFEYMREQKGFKAGLDNIIGHGGQARLDQILRTKRFVEERHVLEYKTGLKLADIHEFDVLDLNCNSMYVNQKVIDIFNRICPDEFEYFPISIETSNGISHRYFIINIINNVKNSIDLDASKFEIMPCNGLKLGDKGALWSFKRLILKRNALQGFHLARLWDSAEIMMSKEIVKALKAANVEKYYYSCENYVNGFYTMNELPNGELI